ncbi:MAG: T9SS type A sorting domain-containing protein [Bacteroidetes bacterium]|nr:T9SS type A sorting domain-containing protein [Bacteroidota bacterium]
MKKIVSINIFILLSSICYSQNRDNVWMLGYDFISNNDRCGIDFSSGTPDTFSVQSPMKFFITNSSMCDTNSNLLFYTNGQWIANSNFDTLPNSENFNSGWATDSFYTSGLGFTQGVIALHAPNEANKYYLFYITGESLFPYHLPTDSTTYYDGQPFHLSYSVIDMSLDGGLGGIDTFKKNIHAIDDTITLGRLTACKHANGRDWWVITSKWYSNTYYKILISPDGVSPAYAQQIGSMVYPSDGLRDFDYRSQAVFSPDGSKYAMVSQSNELHLYDFDRCSGDLSNFRIAYIDTTNERITACSFSPSGRFLYVSGYYNLYQFDTWNPDLQASQELVAQWDSTVDSVFGIQQLFFTHQLAPDGKIYINNFGGSRTMHVIDSPDIQGMLCNVQQHSFTLPNYNSSIPNFPNYDLGALVGSVCDTLTTINSIPIFFAITVFPNPAKDYFTINYDFQNIKKADFVLYNALGEMVLKEKLYGVFKTLVVHTENLSTGIYYYHITDNESEFYNGKVSLVK